MTAGLGLRLPGNRGGGGDTLPCSRATVSITLAGSSRALGGTEGCWEVRGGDHCRGHSPHPQEVPLCHQPTPRYDVGRRAWSQAVPSQLGLALPAG